LLDGDIHSDGCSVSDPRPAEGAVAQLWGEETKNQRNLEVGGKHFERYAEDGRGVRWGRGQVQDKHHIVERCQSIPEESWRETIHVCQSLSGYSTLREREREIKNGRIKERRNPVNLGQERRR
jgi:hypothetical protein